MLSPRKYDLLTSAFIQPFRLPFATSSLPREENKCLETVLWGSSGVGCNILSAIKQ
jgi:hypothetical protein